MSKNRCFQLLILPILLIIGALSIQYLNHSKYITTDTFTYVGVLCAFCLVISFIMMRYLPRGDRFFIVMPIFLSSIGSIEILRLKPELFHTQLIWISLGLIIYCLTIILRNKILDLLNYPYILGLTALLIIFSVLLLGTDIAGNKNWIILGPIQFQPSEFAKLFIIAFLAAFLADNKNVLTLPSRKWYKIALPPMKYLAPLLVIWIAAILLFVYLRDLGSALLFFGIAVIMTYVATGKKRYALIAILFFSIASVISYHLFGHVRTRVEIFLNPWADPTGAAYQIVQSLFAFAYGGVMGTGYTSGYPTLIPAAHTDFVFSAIGEEFGLIGVTMVLLAYLILFTRGVKTALYLQNLKYKFLAFGLSIMLLWQSFIIIAGVTKLLPLTGITLPFISYGGSSMVSSYISLGLLYALSTKENN